MKYNKFIFLLLFLTLNLYSQTFLDFVTRANNTTEKQSVIDSFMNSASKTGFPFIEGNFAHFIYRGYGANQYISGDFNNWSGMSDQMINIQGTDFYYLRKQFEPDARLDYKIVRGSDWILDPLNKNTCSGGYGPNSELAMSGYIQPDEIKFVPNIPHGVIQDYNIYSKDLKASYLVRVYCPPTYFASPLKKYPSIYVQDGSEYLSLGYMNNVIDNLIYSKEIDEIISVFIKPNNRNDEYAFTKRTDYEKFLINQVVPWIDSIYRTIKNPNLRGIMGASYGGNISSYISYRNPQVFALCGNHSPAYQPNNNEVDNMLRTGDKKDIKIYMDWGTYEGLWQPLRSLRDLLISKGYQLLWNEWHEGHSWGSWRAHTDNLLKYFFKEGTVNIEPLNKTDEKSFEIHQNYPNPFNPSTMISYQLPINSYVTLKIYDTYGREIETLANKNQTQGIYQIIWSPNSTKGGLPSGIYYYRLSTENFTETKKCILMK